MKRKMHLLTARLDYRFRRFELWLDRQENAPLWFCLAVLFLLQVALSLS